MKRLVYFILVMLAPVKIDRRQTKSFPRLIWRPTAGSGMKDGCRSTTATSLYIEVSMLPSNSMGEGSYRLLEFVEGENADPEPSAKVADEGMTKKKPEYVVLRLFVDSAVTN